MDPRLPSLTQNQIYTSACCAHLPAAFQFAVDRLHEADALIYRSIEIDDPEDATRVELDSKTTAYLRDVDRLIGVLQRHLPLHLDAVIALQALVLSVTPPNARDVPDFLQATMEASVGHWLAATPETALRQQIEYLVNRPHVLDAELRRAWEPGPENQRKP